MKKIIISLSVSIWLSAGLYAQEPSTQKKYALGAGISVSAVSGSLGGNLKSDYLVNDKLSFGVKYFMAKFQQDDELNYSVNPGETSTHIYDPGHDLNIDLVSTYYIAGKNRDGKGGFYTNLGLGYNDWKYSFSASHVNHGSVGSYDQVTTSKSYVCLVGLGGDLKVGPGRIYFELPFSFGIYVADHEHYSNKTGDYLGSSLFAQNALQEAPVNYVGMGKFAVRSFLLNLGYSLFF